MKNSLRVLFCSPYKEGEDGGIYKWTSNITGYYNSFFSDVKLVHVYNKDEKPVYASDRILKRLILAVNNYGLLVLKVKQTVKNGHFDVAHFCTSASISLMKDIFLQNIVHRKGVKSVIHFHFGRIPDIFKSNNWETYLLKKLLDKADSAIVMDLPSYNTLLDQGYTNIHFIPNPISNDTLSIINKYQQCERDSRKITFVGHVVESKGLTELIKALIDIDGYFINIVGKVPDKKYKTYLIGLAVEKSLRIVFRGMLPYDQTIKEICTSRLLVLPSYSEGFPNVILESMACRCPIVATTVGAIPQMLNSDSNSPCGICVPPKDVDELKCGIMKMLNEVTFSTSCVEEAYNRVREVYCISNVWKLLLNVWKSLN